MPLFICPRCGKALHVPETYFGMRGRCAGCDGRIALIGTPGVPEPQMASWIEETPSGPEIAPPVTKKQREYLCRLGMPEHMAAALNRRQASETIALFQILRRECLPPTRAQQDYLLRSGIPREQIKGIRTQAAASQMIDAAHLPPTRKQFALLKKLRVPRNRLAGITTRSEAAAYIAQLLEHRRGLDGQPEQ